MEVVMYTDGAAKGNPGPGGWGAIVADEKEVIELGGREDHTTNNRMELCAVIEALRYAQKYKDAHVTVYADSEYVVKGATSWGKGWRKNGWMTSQKKPVLNRDLWEPLLSLIDTYSGRVAWHVVGGHVGVVGNERADKIADRFARGEPASLYRGPRSAYGIDLSDLSVDPALQKARTQSRSSTAGQKAHSYVSLVDGEVQVHHSWKECEARVRGKMARFKKALTADEEAAIVQQFQTAPGE